MDEERIKEAVRMLLEAVGEDPKRPGLKRTPQRVADMLAEIFSGMNEDPAEIVNVIPDEDHDEIVIVRDIPFYSVCEHHLLPFHGKAHVAYMPSGSVCGLSKIARVVESYARRPQIQERMTSQIAKCLMDSLQPRGVMVILEAEHLCMTMRGIKKAGAIATTSALRGLFRTLPATRAEAMALIKD
ncbi:MAG: GTP cyclohydrolase I FolE [Planctomycetota bacterium]|nr:GTP cyclohydrolase I FolE [Planctomycetota bacterium]